MISPKAARECNERAAAEAASGVERAVDDELSKFYGAPLIVYRLAEASERVRLYLEGKYTAAGWAVEYVAGRDQRDPHGHHVFREAGIGTRSDPGYDPSRSSPWRE